VTSLLMVVPSATTTILAWRTKGLGNEIVKGSRVSLDSDPPGVRSDGGSTESWPRVFDFVRRA
jgi:hypothetical protein